MKTNFSKIKLALMGTVLASAVVISGCSNSNKKEEQVSNEVASANAVVDAERENMKTLLTRFDSLDFQVYSKQKWEDLHASHAEDILVHYPDGHTSKGISDHIKELSPMFVFAPDTKVTEHTVMFGHGEWTSVIGVLEGTFTDAMPIGNGKTIPPTGKKFHLDMCTVGHWIDGKMVEEYLFWDNMSFMKQIGLAQ